MQDVLTAAGVGDQAFELAAAQRLAALERLVEFVPAVFQRGDHGHRIAQRRVQLVRDTGDQPAQRGQLFRLDQLALRGLQLRHRLRQFAVAGGQLGGALGNLLLQRLRMLAQAVEGFEQRQAHALHGLADAADLVAALDLQRLAEVA